MDQPLWTAGDVARALGVAVAGNWAARGVSIDTRTLAPGDIFVALQAARDGHDFVAQALAKGAAAALVSRVPDGVAADAPLILVPDVLAALERLGQAARARTVARVIAVTGSVGKTSTKEMLRAILAPQGRVHAAEASYNNHWGVPLTLARMPADADFAVIEIGMNHPGEIAPLSRLTRPHVGVITTVGAAHLEAFADINGIAHEKAAIFSGLEPGGVALVNADLDTTPILRAAAHAVGARIVTFGQTEGCDWRLTGTTLGEETTDVRAEVAGKALAFTLAAAGRHFAQNALAALAAVQAAGGDVDRALASMGLWHPPAGRGTRAHLTLPGGAKIALIDDAFNANPASMAAGLDMLIATPATGRRMAILGDMLELGPTELALHRAIAQHPGLSAVATIHCAGPRMAALWADLPPAQRGLWFDTAEALAAALSQAAQAGDFAQTGDVVLVKGSKSSKISLVVDALSKLGQHNASGAKGNG